mmetsp:Transcript_16431/g.41508  ORF Transcript_16431/g.41508 Transcript_16431/m.41508 type:complete len:359 (-) Transcript_16431:2390-3466(-)
MAKMMARATTVFCPPDSEFITRTSPPAWNRTETETPTYLRIPWRSSPPSASSSSSLCLLLVRMMSSPEPPGTIFLNTSAKFLATIRKVVLIASSFLWSSFSISDSMLSAPFWSSSLRLWNNPRCSVNWLNWSRAFLLTSLKALSFSVTLCRSSCSFLFFSVLYFSNCSGWLPSSLCCACAWSSSVRSLFLRSWRWSRALRLSANLLCWRLISLICFCSEAPHCVLSSLALASSCSLAARLPDASSASVLSAWRRRCPISSSSPPLPCVLSSSAWSESSSCCCVCTLSSSSVLSLSVLARALRLSDLALPSLWDSVVRRLRSDSCCCVRFWEKVWLSWSCSPSTLCCSSTMSLLSLLCF